MRLHDSAEHSTNHGISPEHLADCRNHLETLQNLRYLISVEANYPMQVRLRLRMMERHLRNLAEILLEPH